MALPIKDADGNTVYLDVEGTGTALDPYRPTHGVDSLPSGIQTSLTAIQASVAAATPAGEAHIGMVGYNRIITSVALTMTAGSGDDGSIVADMTAVANAVRANNGFCVLESVVVLDKDDVGAALWILFASKNNSLGTKNAAPDISDANAEYIYSAVKIDTTDYVDVGGAKIATLGKYNQKLGQMIQADTATTTIYVGVLRASAGSTYSASGLTLKIALQRL
jgi:hypothetical protein